MIPVFTAGIRGTQHIIESNADELATLIKRFLSLDFTRSLFYILPIKLYKNLFHQRIIVYGKIIGKALAPYAS